MKSLMYAVVYVAVLLGTALAHLHLPKGELELRTYPKVSATEFAVMREEALRLVAGNAELDMGLSGNRYFELNCRSEPTLLVDNSSSQLLIISQTSRAHEKLALGPFSSAGAAASCQSSVSVQAKKVLLGERKPPLRPASTNQLWSWFLMRTTT